MFKNYKMPELNIPAEGLLHPDLQRAKEIYNTLSQLAKEFQSRINSNQEVGIVPLAANGREFYLYQMYLKDSAIWLTGKYANGDDALIVTTVSQTSFQFIPLPKLSDTQQLPKIGF